MASVAARQPDALLSWMGGLADPTRLRLLRVLERNELGVAELVDVLQLPQSTVSRHLKVLADQGWVAARAQRTANLYRMTPFERDAPARRLWLLAREQTEAWATVRQDQLRLERVLADRSPAAQAFFAGAAGEWDRMRQELYGDAFTSHALAALLPPDSVVADLACGTGQATAAVAPHVRRVIGVDQSAAMLKAARRRTAALSNVELRQGPLEELPLDAASCDGALLLLALTYVDEPARAVAEMARVLKPGGRAVAVDLLRHDRDDFREAMGQKWPGFELHELESAFAAAGLTGVRVRPLAPVPDAKGPALLIATAGKDSRKGDDER
ncbi:MAG TPA: metalloregulator ArsR/SmtB family transcription factor [Vicinamibacteria bacterium]|nr:metalloregulator ArsR/SmtB family transcription factor [Vicinamibacteria bacterium]